MPEQPIFYNTQHAPIGAFASFTLGAEGAKGGFGLELARPADQNVYIGVEQEPGNFSCLPFFEPSQDESTRFDVEATTKGFRSRLTLVAESAIERQLTPGRDEWKFGQTTFAIHSPVLSAPDPDTASRHSQAMAYAPAVVVELTVDTRGIKNPQRVIFGFQSTDRHRGLRMLEEVVPDLPGIACGDSIAIASCSPGLTAAIGFTPESILEETQPFNLSFGIGNTGLLIGSALPGRISHFRMAVCFHRAGTAATGLDARYLYTRFFTTLESVALFASENFLALKNRSRPFDRRFEKAGNLSADRRFMMAQAIHSYYGSTELLEVKRRPLWVVNEGEYRMINTFDLMADQVFFEVMLNPWTVRNELDWYLRRYSYTDTLRMPGSDEVHPGGLTFTHDMGTTNHFTPPGRSVYEKTGLSGCFSHMSHEELVNWAICALLYIHRTRDFAWARRRRPVLNRILTSLLNRDHPDPAKRDGVMSLDSSRCGGGAEITTYDSLDVSLGQARNNLYLAGKCWGCYVGLEDLFLRLDDHARAATCAHQSRLAADTICASADEKGLLPAILGENIESRIIPAIEGLIIPHQLGLHEALQPHGPHGELIQALSRHLRGILVPGTCLFPDGGWKISSTSNNSWLSKIYLCQFIAENILHAIPAREQLRADASHAAWLSEKTNSYWAWSDQFVSGAAVGSKYYPRGVTSILWLQ